MSTPTPGDLSARHVEVLNELRIGVEFDAHCDPLGVQKLEALDASIAALSALPAGGEGCGDHDHARFIPGCPKCALTLPEKRTTPPADAHPDDGCLDCLRKERGGPADAAVRAPVEEAQKILADAIRLASDGVSFNTPADAADWMREALSAAPAAGKGVDDAMVERFCAAFFTPKWPTSSTHNDNVLRGMVRPALEAALTRQPVAGGGWRPIETAPQVESMLSDIPRCLVYSKDFGIQMGRAWRYADGEARGQGDGFNGEWNVTHFHPLPAAPAATPTDGGAGE